MFVGMKSSDLRKLKDTNFKVYSNLTVEEKRALEHLGANENIICKPSDKWGNIVIMDRQKYIDMVQRLLSDRATY